MKKLETIYTNQNGVDTNIINEIRLYSILNSCVCIVTLDSEVNKNSKSYTKNSVDRYFSESKYLILKK